MGATPIQSSLPRIGPYRIVSELGRGAMGVVHLALDPGDNYVALKSVANDDPRLAARMLREASIRIEHPNLVRILGAGLDPSGRPFIAMERLVGRSLASHFASGPSPAEVIEWVTQAAEGVAALHERGIVHRDLKPANLFLTDDGVVKVLDFGAAAIHESTTLLTLSGSLVGTPSYFSPEQARGEGTVDARADLWALGVVLYEGLTGTRPFDRSNAIATTLAVIDAPIPSLHLDASDGALATLVSSCLSKNRDDRPASARALLERLRSLQRRTSPHAPASVPPGPITALRRVATVLVDGVEDRAELARLAAHARASYVPLLASGAAITFGHDIARGDELPVAVRFALLIAPLARHAVVTTARTKGSDAFDAAALSEAETLLALGVPGTVVSTEVHALLADTIRVERVGTGAHRVVSLDREILGELVGREVEHARIGRLLDRVIASDGPRLCSLIGPQGIGKSALARLFVTRARRQVPELVVVEATGGLDDRGPFAALAAALDVDAEVDGEIGSALQTTLDRRRARVIDALWGLLEGGAVVTLVLEDLPWLDAATRALAPQLLELFQGRRLLVVTTSRDPIAGLFADELVELLPLGTMDVAAMASRALEPSVGAALAAELALRSGGNPLFVEQLLRHAERTGVHDITSLALPATIESAVQAQIDSLDPALRQALLRLAVLGAEFETSHAAHTLGRSDVLVDRLVQAEVLARIERRGRTSLAFRSRLLAEVAYGLVDPVDAARLHRELASRLAADPCAAPELVARHAVRGGENELASRFARVALRDAARAGDGANVLAHLALALEHATDEERFELTLTASESAAFVEGARLHAELLERARNFATTDAQRIVVDVELAERFRRDGSIELAGETLERVLAETLDATTRVRATCRYAHVLVTRGEAPRALELVRPRLPELPAAIAALVWDTRAYAFGACGALGDRRRAYERARRLYAEAGDLRRCVGAESNVGDSMLRMGALEDAEATLRKAIDGARRIGSRLIEAYARTNLGAALGELDRAREGVAVLDSAIRLAGELDDLRLESIARLYRARITMDAPLGALEALASASRDDPMLHALVLATMLEIGLGDDTRVEDALALARSGRVLEEGMLELCRALATRVSLDTVLAIATPHLERVAESIDQRAWAKRFAAYVARHYASVGARWLSQR